MTLLSFREVSFAYPRLFGKGGLALENISFTIEEGEAFGFIGQNGAGKSTAIKLLLGLARPHNGSILLNKMDPLDYRARRSVGYVPELPSLPTTLTPREVLAFANAIHSQGGSINDNEISLLLDQLDITKVADQRIGKFSKGMAQRVAIAMALVGKPKLLVLDEPLSGLDPKGRTDVINLLASYQAGGGAVFFSSHVLHDVERLADRAALIHQGSIHAIHEIGTMLSEAQACYSVRYSGEPLDASCQQVRRGVCLFDCTQNEVASKISTITSNGGVVLEVKPKDSLESRFLSMIS